MSQVDFFADGELSLTVAQCVENLPEVTKHWPQDAQALFEHMRVTFGRDYNDETATQLAMKALIEMAKYGGGQYIYFPKMESLSMALRDIQIWKKFNGRNVRNLAKEFNLTVQRVYAIVAEQRKIEVQRNQPSLF